MTKNKFKKWSKRLWKNNYFKLLLIPILVGLCIILFTKLLSDDKENSIEYFKIESYNQEGGITAGKIENVNVNIESKDEIIAEKYYTALYAFMTKFRMLLFSYYLEYNNHIPKEIDELFKISSFPDNINLVNGNNIKIQDLGSIRVVDLNNNIIEQIFATYDFNSRTGVRFFNNKPALLISEPNFQFEFVLPKNIELRTGDLLTGYIWFIGELKVVQNSLRQILSSYGSVGNPNLIDDIERLIIDIENIVQGQGLNRLPVFEHRDIELIKYFFERYRNSYYLCQPFRTEQDS